MTDPTSQANGHAPGAESERRANPDWDETPGYGAAAGGTAPTTPDSGEASAWPGWPGVARPAGWFLPVPRKAVPPGRPGMEPAGADAGPEPEKEPSPRQSDDPPQSDALPQSASPQEAAGAWESAGPPPSAGLPQSVGPQEAVGAWQSAGL